jgi:hypothetical protein
MSKYLFQFKPRRSPFKVTEGSVLTFILKKTARYCSWQDLDNKLGSKKNVRVEYLEN